MESFTWMKLCVKEVQEIITSCFQKHNATFSPIVICKRHKQMKDGDMIVPSGVTQSLSKETIQTLIDELTQILAEHRWKVSRITSPSYCTLAVHFHRETLYRNILPLLWKSDVFSRKVEHKHKGQVLLNFRVPNNSTQSTEDVRAFILLQHITNLLNCCGYNVSAIPISLSEDKQKLIQKIRLDPSLICSAKEVTVEPFSDIAEKCNLQKCRYLIYKYLIPNTEENSDNSASSCENGDKNRNCSAIYKCLGWDENKRVLVVDPGDEDISVDLKLYIEEKSIGTGRGNYEKSLKTLTPAVSNKDGSCTDIMMEVKHLQHFLEQTGGCVTVVHLNIEKQFYHQQKVDLLWRAIFGERNCQQIHINYGLVTSRQGTSDQKVMNAEEFIELRFTQMKEAAVMKYGEKVKGSNWDETITRLTIASLKFEFLMTNHRNIVKLDLSQGQEFGGGVDNRAGAFVMYNCARLSTLFRHFEENVSKGIYPPLPDINSIDFSTLREEDEWELFYNYIFVYPELIVETTQQFIPEDSIISKILTHKVCNFLVGLSRHLSSYYSRTHVLGENRAHLLPTMYARLYLLKVVHKVVCHGLSLMGIVPLNQL